MRTVPFFAASLFGICARAQAIDTVLLHEESFVHHPFVYSTFASLIDRNGQPFLYTADVEYGLRIHDIGDPSAPLETAALWPAAFGGSKPTNLFQQDDLLYVTVGGFQGTAQNAGLAVLDVSDPTNVSIIGQWDSTAFTHGAAIVRVQDGFAYIGAMQDGLIILNVSDPTHISFVSSFQPDPSWPGIVNYPPNARGMDLKGDTLFLAYDAGGLRSIDVSDKSAPHEIGGYVNPLQPVNTADAYNNIRIVGDRCFVATDFCGFEVVDISDPANMQQVAWVNPWNCNGLSWFGSDGHANELITAMHDSLLFVGSGDSELMIYDITAPNAPQLVGGLIHPNDSSVTWGVDVKDSLVVLGYIDNSLVIFPPQPYYADNGGFQILTWNADLTTGIVSETLVRDGITLSPVPTEGFVHLHRSTGGPCTCTFRDAMGRSCLERSLTGADLDIDLRGLRTGIYFVEVHGPGRTWISRIAVD